MHVTLYQPEIAGNVGAIMRSCACFGAGLTLIEPCGFPLGDKRMRRAAMDYAVPGGLQSALDWKSYRAAATGRQVLMTTIHAESDARVIIPMVQGARSLNLSNSVVVTLFEALRQTNRLP